MSRDFLIECHDAEEAKKAQYILEQVVSQGGAKLFDIDNRGNSLFVMLTYPADIPIGMNIMVGNHQIENFRDHVAFVAIKNGEHNGIGYLIDTGTSAPEQNSIPLSLLPSMIAGAFGLDWNAQTNLKTTY